MEAAIITLHVLICLTLIVIVLLQQGKGADIGAVFGGGGSNTLFGPRGAATALSKITIGAAVLFMVTCLSLAVISSRAKDGSVMDAGGEIPAPVETNVPPAPPEAGEDAPPGDATGGAATGTQVLIEPGGADTDTSDGQTAAPASETPGPDETDAPPSADSLAPAPPPE